MRDRRELSRAEQGGWHSVYRGEDGELVVEWVEYRDPAPYDHVTRLVFSSEEEAALRGSLGVSDAETSTPAALAERFATYWAVRAHADAHALSYATDVDFQP